MKKALKKTSSSLGDCAATPTSIRDVYDYCDCEDCMAAREEESTMNTTNTFDDTAAAKSHMKDRIESHYREVECALERKYLSDDLPPKTAAEIVERIKAGNIVLPDTTKPGYDAWNYTWQPYLGIRWRHPDKKVDREAFDKALKTLHSDRMDTITKVTVLAKEEGLKALESFKAKHPVE
jgi:hypothetical protein